MINTKSNYNSFYWNSLEKFGNQAIQFIIGVVLARILSPQDYGLVGLLLAFTAVAEIFVDSGFTKALIQRNDKSKNDLSTAFSFNLFISMLLYVILWFSAPYIGEFYKEQVLVNLLRILALILIINALFTIPNTILTIDLEFKTIAKINSLAVIVSGITAIVLALNGFGVWSLVMQYLLKSLITLILFTIKSKWSYRLSFDKESFKRLFGFGSNLMISSLLNVVVGKFSSLFIAKVLSTSELGYYTRGMQFPDVAIGTLGSVLDTVLLPTLAKNKDKVHLKIQLSKIFKILSLITVPLTVILAVLAKPIVLFLLTDKWLPIVPILQLFCISRFFNNLISVNINVLYVLNRADLVLRQHWLKIAVRIILILLALPFGIIYIALAEALTSISHFLINCYYPGKLISFGIKEQLLEIKTYLSLGVFMYILLFLLNKTIDSPLISIIVISLSGLLLYLIMIYLFKRKDFNIAMNFIKSKTLQ